MWRTQVVLRGNARLAAVSFADDHLIPRTGRSCARIGERRRLIAVIGGSGHRHAPPARVVNPKKDRRAAARRIRPGPRTGEATRPCTTTAIARSRDNARPPTRWIGIPHEIRLRSSPGRAMPPRIIPAVANKPMNQVFHDPAAPRRRCVRAPRDASAQRTPNIAQAIRSASRRPSPKVAGGRTECPPPSARPARLSPVDERARPDNA